MFCHGQHYNESGPLQYYGEPRDVLFSSAVAEAKDIMLAHTTSLFARPECLAWSEAASGFSCDCTEGILKRLDLMPPIVTTSHDLFGNHRQLFYCILMPVPFFNTEVTMSSQKKIGNRNYS